MYDIYRVKRLPVIVIILYTIVALVHSVAKQKRTGDMYLNDVAGYYVYLPAAFIYNDLGELKFHEQRDAAGQWFLHEQPNGKKLIKYTMGVAVMSAPFFFAAHAYASLSGGVADGYSYPYQLAGLIASIFYTVLGLLLLARFLKKYFGPGVIAMVISCIGLGTNLFYYTANDAGMSHPISFFLFSALLLLTQRWHEHKKNKQLILLAAVASMIVLVRPVNAVVLLLPLLWNVRSAGEIKDNFTALVKDAKMLLVCSLIFLTPLLLQMAYWHFITGQWIVNSYQGEYFKFSEPHIYKGLFSFRKGWFVYTPLAFISFAGFIALWRKQRPLVMPLLAVLAIAIYITFCWRMWWYGGSFGCRPLIEYFALLSLPLAALIEKLYSKKLLQEVSTVFFLAVIGLNLFQTYQYSRLVIHWDRMSRAAYFKVWGKTEMRFEELEPYLLSEKEYWAEIARASKP